MSVINNNLLLTAPAAASGYQISRSLRFNAPSSKFLNRTFASAGNRKTWTWAAWFKPSRLAGTGGNGGHSLFSCRNGAGDDGITDLIYNTDGTLLLTGGTNTFRTTTQVLRDFSAWYHLVLAVDTTSATADNRIRIYINGVEVTTFNTKVNPSQNFDLAVNQAAEHRIGGYDYTYFNGYLADIYFISAQQLDPSSFTTTDATTGQLIPKAYTGSYGTNGFHLEFADNSAATATTLGKDSSGLGNNWTPNNLSVTAGAGNDSLVDVPTNGPQTDTGVGGEVRGNYCTLNPLHSYVATSSDGNLYCNTNASGWIGSTIHMYAGKWYAEFTVNTGIYHMFGLCTSDTSGSGYPWQAAKPGVTYYAADGRIYVDGVNTGTIGSASATSGDIISFAFDVDAKSVAIRKNNTLLVSKTIGTATSYMFYISDGGGTITATFNAGARPFAYTAPSGFKALCTTNLPAPTIVKPSTVMDVKLYTGNGGTQTIGGLGFSPDLVWIKSRSNTRDHQLYDVIRGAQNPLLSNSTLGEGSPQTGLTSFDASGFSLGDYYKSNEVGQTFVAWTWDAGTSTVTNTQGSITSSVRANATAGFSVVTYTVSSSSQTAGHGLGVAPSFVICKRRDSTSDWYFQSKIPNANGYLLLNSTAALTSASYNFTSTTFQVGYLGGTNEQWVAYCFAPVVGYSSFGTYTGNGADDGPFVYTGFKIRWLMIKKTSATGSWILWDTARSTYNMFGNKLAANLSSAENDAATIGYDYQEGLDLNANGFKCRSSNQFTNTSGATYVYAAFAESPFNYARAR